MHTRILAWWDRILTSYWFIPAVMAAGAWLLAGLLLVLEPEDAPGFLRRIPWFYANQPEGARAVLSTIAGSMITVAGVTFTITIAAVSYTAGQFGPRILTNFMRDRGNQVTLGTFIATFLYCILLLRTVRAPDEAAAQAPPGEAVGTALGGFVPHLGIAGALVLAVLSVAVLIYFLHHVPESIHISNVVAVIGKELNGRVGELFPGRLGDALGEDAGEDREGFLASLEEDAVDVEARREGYIQRLDEDRLLRLAEEGDLRIRLRYRPGDFVARGRVLLVAGPSERMTDEMIDRLYSVFIFGRSRNHVQDVLFLAEELAEIAARALSPGVNDPFTAITCMDWLGAALTGCAPDDPPSALRAGPSGAARILAEPERFEHLVDITLRETRQYVAADRNAILHALMVTAEVALDLDDDDKREYLRDAVEELVGEARGTLGDHAVGEVEARLAVVRDILDGRLHLPDAHGMVPWLRGSA